MYVQLVGGPPFENTGCRVVGCAETVCLPYPRIAGYSVNGHMLIHRRLLNAYGVGRFLFGPVRFLFFSEAVVLDDRVVALLPSEIERFMFSSSSIK
jgi:hypothetical protein